MKAYQEMSNQELINEFAKELRALYLNQYIPFFSLAEIEKELLKRLEK